MEQRFNNNSLDLETLREFCKREGEIVTYRKGDQLEREGNPARWLAYVTKGCFKYVKHGKCKTILRAKMIQLNIFARFILLLFLYNNP